MGQLCIIIRQTARSVCSLVYWVWIILDTHVCQLMPNDCLFQPWELKVLYMFPRAVRVFVLSTSCYWGQKYIFFFEQNTKEIKEDISIVKLNISNLHKAIILQEKFTETIKNRSSVYYSVPK